MENAVTGLSHVPQGGFLAEVTRALLFIHDSQASGRLSLRNGERGMLLHLYFNAARLVHVTGNKQDAVYLLNDLLNWTRGGVRIDAGLLVPYETLTWQQAQVFARWLAFLEMRGIMQGIARSRLQGLTQSLTSSLPGEPIQLPDEVARYDEYNEEPRARQWQRINDGMHQLVERTLSEKQRDQLKETTQRMNQALQQAGDVTQDVVKRVSRTAQEGLAQAVAAAQDIAQQGTRRAEELVKQSLSQERRQEMFLSAQRAAASMTGETQEAALQSVQGVPRTGTPLPPELQARSIRYRHTLSNPSPATRKLGEEM